MLLDLEDVCRAKAKEFSAPHQIHPDDFIFRWLLKLDEPIREYFRNGHSSAQIVVTMLQEFLPGCTSLLDFASGYGCVARHLPGLAPNIDVTCCDIHQAAVTFLAEDLGLKAVLSTKQPEALSIDRQFDAVLALSFFSHIPDKTWGRWLSRLAALVRPGGAIIFTTNGNLAAKAMYVEIGDSEIVDGYFFNPLSEQSDLSTEEYGTTIALKEYVERQVAAVPSVKIIDFRDAFWWGFQDAYILRKA